MNTLTALDQAYNLARTAAAAGKLCSKRLERARALATDRRTIVLPSGQIEFPSETAGWRTASTTKCDCPDHAPHGYCKHILGAMLLRRATEIETTARMLSGEAPGLLS